MFRAALLLLLLVLAPGPDFADLIDDLASKDAYVRELARKQIFQAGAEAIPHLEKALGSDNNHKRDQCLKTLEMFLHHSDRSVQAAAQAVLLRVRPLSTLKRDVLLAALEDPRGPASAVVPQLLKIMATREDVLKAAAGKAFTHFGKEARFATPKLIEMGRAAAWPQRFAVIDALAAIGPTVAAPLLEAYAEGGKAVRAWAPEVFFRLKEGVIAAGLPALQSKDRAMRTAACDMLGFARPQFAAQPLAAALHDGAGSVRRAAARALGGLGQESISALVLAAADEQRRAQREAVQALAEILLEAGAAQPRAVRKATHDERKRIARATAWLRQNQETTGAWDTGRHGGGVGYVPGVTALALIALTEGGSDDANRNAIERGLRYLVAAQDAEGNFGPRASQHFLYNHAIGTLAMCIAWGETKNPTYGAAAQRALDFAAKARSREGGWRYQPAGNDSDTSITAWMIMAVRRGLLTGLRVDPECFSGTRRYIGKTINEKNGLIGYRPGNDLAARPTGLREKYPETQTRAMTAAGAVALFCAGGQPLRLTMKEAMAFPPVWDTKSGRLDMYYWHQATRLYDIWGGGLWTKWATDMRKAVAKGQAEDGSWPPVGPWGKDGGTVYSTALMTTCLRALDGRLGPLRYKLPRAANLRPALAVLQAASKHPDQEISRAATTSLWAFP